MLLEVKKTTKRWALVDIVEGVEVNDTFEREGYAEDFEADFYWQVEKAEEFLAERKAMTLRKPL